MGWDRDSGVKWGGMAGLRRKKWRESGIWEPLLWTLHASGRSSVTLSGVNKLTPVLCKEITFEKDQPDSCQIIHTLESPWYIPLENAFSVRWRLSHALQVWELKWLPHEVVLARQGFLLASIMSTVSCLRSAKNNTCNNKMKIKNQASDPRASDMNSCLTVEEYSSAGYAIKVSFTTKSLLRKTLPFKSSLSLLF